MLKNIFAVKEIKYSSIEYSRTVPVKTLIVLLDVIDDQHIRLDSSSFEVILL